jgi:RHS repeat-associated protein
VGGTEDDTGLVHLGFREYDPSLGRFVSVDPIMDLGQPQQWHGYAYADNNPTTFSDPSGLLKEEMGMGSGGGNSGGCATSSRAECLANSALAYLPIVGTAIEGGLTVYYLSQGDFQKALESGAWLVVGTATQGLARIGGKLIKLRNGTRPPGKVPPGATIKNPYGKSNIDTAGDVADIKRWRRPKPAKVAPTPKPNPKPKPPNPNVGKSPTPAKSSCQHSFHPATPVLMADGTRRRIADVREGDKVIATDPVSGETAAKPVTDVHRNNDRDLADVTIRDTKSGGITVLHTTANHPFWKADTQRWTEAKDLQPGDRLLSPDGDTARMITAVKTWTGLKWMHDLTIADIHTYYVIAGNTPVLVHNCDTVDPNELRFSQNTAGGRGRAGSLRQSMSERGWDGDPVDVVRTQDGLTTIDNTRVAVAQELELLEIPVNIHTPDELLPKDMLGRFGSAATWGEALIHRASRQRPPLGPTGIATRPRMP